MIRYIFSAVVVLAGALASTACGDHLGTYGGGGTGGAVVVGGSGGFGGTVAVGGTGGTGGTGDVLCLHCACDFKSNDLYPGCADTCDNTISGQPTPNFCNGSPALAQCEACIMQRCGSTSATCE